MGCLAIFLNLLLPGLGTILFTSKKNDGFIQIVLGVINYLLVFATFGLWGFIGFFVGIGLFAWSLASTITFMSEQSAKRAIQEERESR